MRAPILDMDIVNRRMPTMCQARPAEEGRRQRRFVIIGAGAAGMTAAQTLRESGFDGEITMITNESVLPYDRVKLSKAMSAEVDRIQLRDRVREGRVCSASGVVPPPCSFSMWTVCAPWRASSHTHHPMERCTLRARLLHLCVAPADVFRKPQH